MSLLKLIVSVFIFFGALGSGTVLIMIGLEKLSKYLYNKYNLSLTEIVAMIGAGLLLILLFWPIFIVLLPFRRGRQKLKEWLIDGW